MKMNLELPVSPGDVLYRICYTKCHKGETLPYTEECDWCRDKCDMGKEVRKFVVPNINWILANYEKLKGENCYFSSEEEAKKYMRAHPEW